MAPYGKSPTVWHHMVRVHLCGTIWQYLCTWLAIFRYQPMLVESKKFLWCHKKLEHIICYLVSMIPSVQKPFPTDINRYYPRFEPTIFRFRVSCSYHWAQRTLVLMASTCVQSHFSLKAYNKNCCYKFVSEKYPTKMRLASTFSFSSQ